MKKSIRALSLAIMLCCPAAAAADGFAPVTLQYFEASWDTIRYRTPDIFLTGYEGIWLPPPQRGAQGTASIGYDLFDRFDLGTDADPTRYGSETDFRLMVDELHRAGVQVFVDWIMNHNASFDNNSATDPLINNGQTFLDNGGYPGFALELPADTWGDFHPPGTQSEDPGGANYNLFDGRLVNLIDIDQFQTGVNYEFIRHPVAVDPDNIPMPPTAVRNQPDPNNARFYPDLSLTPTVVTNPGFQGNPGGIFTFYPYNLADPMAGDAVMESARDLLLRSTQYYLEVLKVDGFRLDAAKHVPTSFWDTYWDSIVHNRYVGFDGTVQTPFSFVEAVGGGGIDPFDWTRKDGFGNRDALDLDEAGVLRDQVDNPSFKSWDDVLNASIDNRDGGLNNGSLGVHHVSSHDNANSGVNLDTTAHAYVLMRSGRPVVYHNAMEFGATPNNFPNPNGRDDALGLGSDAITTLVKIHNQYVRGRFEVLNGTDPVNPSTNDILVMEHNHDLGGAAGEANVLVFTNDLQTNGQDATDFRSIQTHFPPGTRLHELTGNALNPVVDVPGNPNDDLADLVTVDGSQRVLIKTPRNRNSSGVNHGRGYVVYGPAVPTGTLSIVNATTTVAPPDSAGVPAYRRRLNPVTIVRSATFDIELQTVQTDPSDPNTDNLAVFRIDQGFQDSNGNGGVDYLTPGTPTYGFEDFVDQNCPMFTCGTGLYRQQINAAALGEGYHYITVRAFRQRPAGTDPLFGEFRHVIYVDLQDPDFSLVTPTNTCNADVTSSPVDFVVQATDTTVDRVFVYLDLLDSTDFVALALGGGSGQATRSINTFTLTVGSLSKGNHRVDVVAIEDLPDGTVKTRHKTFAGVQATTGNGLGPGDLDENGVINGKDIRLFVLVALQSIPIFAPAADINCDGLIDEADAPGFVALLLQP